MSEEASLGERIATYRRRRGISQREFAAMVGRSESWVSQVERGARRIDRLSVLHDIADQLGVSVADLSSEAPPPADSSDPPPYLDQLRLAVTGYRAITAWPTSDAASPNIDGVRSEVEGAWALVHACRYAEAAPLLSTLIERLEPAVRAASGSDRPDLYELLSGAYQAAAAVFAKLDDTEAAWVAADRSVLAAERSERELLALAAEWRLALALLSTRRYEQARHIAVAATEVLTPQADEGSPALISLLGAFEHLLATMAARENDRRAAQPIGLHECRHTFASFMIAAGVNAKALSTYMGHASVTITFDLYGHLMPGNEDEAGQLLDAYLRKAIGEA